MPLHFDWGCRTFWTASHVHVIQKCGVWAPSQVVDGHMASHSHCYHHRHFPRLVRSGLNPTWWKCIYHATMLWLSLYDHSNCIPCPCHAYMKCLSMFSFCWWAYGSTLTPLPPPTLPQICESWVKSYLMQVCKPCHYTLIEAVEPFKLHPMIVTYTYQRFEHLIRLWMGIWLHIHTLTITDAPPDLWELAETLSWCKCANHATTLQLRM